MPTKKPDRDLTTQRSTSANMRTDILALKKVSCGLDLQRSRFELYKLLKVIYRIYVSWKRSRVAHRCAQALARKLSIKVRKGMSPIRILIEAGLPHLDLKQKSRSARALEYVYSADVSPSRFRRFVHANGGIAGCAHQAVQVKRKRRRPAGDWND